MKMPRVMVSQLKHNSYFVAGLCAGLWLALAGVPLGEEEAACAAPPLSGPGAPAPDEFVVVREQRPAGGAAAGAGGAPARSVQRPRYYTTELGMRAPLLAAVLSSEDMLESRVAALNRTAARLQPALRFFMSASALGRAGAAPRANVVAFTDTRRMLQPFHALKYLADNYLDDYNFFFLAADTTFINSRRLTELVARLSVSQDLYMGTPADDDSHYCSLEGGILLSNSVLRAVQLALDWCVRNSYSPRHHENLGRCVLHAARTPCRAAAQGSRYESADVSGEAGVARALAPALAGAVTARGVSDPADMYRLHAYVSRVQLAALARRRAELRAELARLRRRAPPHFRNATWPAGLRLDPALRPLLPDNRFDHLRWTAFNETHAFLPDDTRTAAPIDGAHREALQLVWRRARAWAGAGASETADTGAAGASETASRLALLEGAWRWEPPHALRYRLLLAHRQPSGRTAVRQLEVVRPLGAARLAPVPYVTESARVTLLLPVAAAERAAAAAWLQRRRAAPPRNAALAVVMIEEPAGAGEAEAEAEAEAGEAGWGEVRAAFAALAGAQPALGAALLTVPRGALGLTDAGRLALAAAAGAAGAAVEAGPGAGAAVGGRARLARDSLVLLLHPRAEFNDEFLNRVRMNCIAGSAWFLPAPFRRFVQAEHPRYVDARGRRRTARTGRFAARPPRVLGFYKRDWDNALGSWRGAGDASVADILAASALRVLHAPEPALLAAPPRARPCRAPAPAPAPAPATACLRALPLPELALGAPQELAQLLLDTQPPAPAPAPAA